MSDINLEEIIANEDEPAADLPKRPRLNWGIIDREEFDFDNPPDEEPIDDGPSKEEIAKELAAVKTQLAASQQQLGTAEALRQGIADLGQTLKMPQQQQQQAPAGPTKEELEKKLQNAIVEGENVAPIIEQLVQLQIGGDRQAALQGNLYHSRKAVEIDPKLSGMYVKYKSEVEQQINQLSPDVLARVPDIYERVLKNVMALHEDEIVNDRIQAEVEKRVEEALKKRDVGNLPPAQHAEVSTARPVKTKKKFVLGPLAPKEAAYMLRKGISEETYAMSCRDKPEFRKEVLDGKR